MVCVFNLRFVDELAICTVFLVLSSRSAVPDSGDGSGDGGGWNADADATGAGVATVGENS